MKPIVFLLLLVSVLTSCKEKINLDNQTPDCITDRIHDLQQADSDSPQEVWRWEVDGQTYYLFTMDCCDQFNDLYDESCNRVCAPSGGFTGGGDGNCPTWNTEIQRTLIWTN